MERKERLNLTIRILSQATRPSILARPFYYPLNITTYISLNMELESTPLIIGKRWKDISEQVNSNYNFNQNSVGGSQAGVNSSNLMLYDAVVDMYGHGDHVTIQDAINAGKRRIYVRAGNYTLESDVNLVSNLLIKGESQENTIITLKSYKFTGVGDTTYSVGDVVLTNGSDIVTGVGTSWLANLSIGDYFIITGASFKIIAVNSDTEIQIENDYEGISATFLRYYAGTFLSNIEISDITLQGSTGTAGIYLYGTIKSFIHNLRVIDNSLTVTYGIDAKWTYLSKIKDVECSNNYYGIRFWNSRFNSFESILVSNNGWTGMYLLGGDFFQVSNLKSFSNKNNGLSINTGYYLNLNNILVENNVGYGIKLDTTLFVQMSNCMSIDSGSNGYYIVDSSNISLNNCLSYTNSGIGFYCLRVNNIEVLGCQSVENQGQGFYNLAVTASSFIGNSSLNNAKGATNAYSDFYFGEDGGVYSTGNTVKGNTAYALLTNKTRYGFNFVDANEDYNVIEGNVCKGQLVGTYFHPGTNGEKGHNIMIP